MANVLTHFSHKHHKLVKTDLGRFYCDLCGADGNGLRYRCDECDFDIHESCAKLPETISFFAHPWHDLHLMQGRKDRHCDLCFKTVNDFYYRCTSCGFDVHPHCATTKQVVRSKLHPEHDLYLLPSNPCCDACDKFNGLWLYSCGLCEVSLHINCLNGPIMPKATGQCEENNNAGKHDNTSNGMAKTGIPRRRKRDRLKKFLFDFGSEVATDVTADIISESLNISDDES